MTRSNTGKHSPHSVAEATTAKERRSRTRVLLSVVEGFALCFISSSQAMQAKFSEHHWCGASFTQHCYVSFWSLLVLTELKKMKELIWVDRALKDQFQSGFCSSHLTVGKENYMETDFSISWSSSQNQVWLRNLFNHTQYYISYRSDLGGVYSSLPCYTEGLLSFGIFEPQAYQNIRNKRELQYFS